MTHRPNEDYDVIVHQFPQCGTSGAGRGAWTIWLGGEKQGEQKTLASALELACDVAAAHSRPTWLLMRRGIRDAARSAT